uniref:HTH_Tnp_ISL3 domain-containing protein n=1 Tax=Steinernema glaseri TaxID=37863 RepID=A0A1I7Y071_9BILA
MANPDRQCAADQLRVSPVAARRLAGAVAPTGGDLGHAPGSVCRGAPVEQRSGRHRRDPVARPAGATACRGTARRPAGGPSGRHECAAAGGDQDRLHLARPE